MYLSIPLCGFGRFQPSGRAEGVRCCDSFGGTLKTLQAYRPSERFSGWLAIEGVLVDFGPLTGLKTGPSCKQTNTVVLLNARRREQTNTKHCCVAVAPFTAPSCPPDSAVLKPRYDSRARPTAQ